jgi:radical SAM enzyme (TIGR01210 family)
MAMPRPSKAAGLDPFRPHGYFLEQERAQSGRLVQSAAILLTNKECPWRCLMCDLWKHTLSHPVPLGAIPAQIDYALEQLGTQPEQLKLYNSGSFFDSAAIPPADYPGIAQRIACAEHVVVESHPRLVAEKAVRFRDLLRGSLEVAMGLETVHPLVLPRLNKRFDLTHFARATNFLRNHGIAVRAFVLLKPPFLNEEEAIEWALKSAEFAFSCGATAVSIIPTRAGNGAMDRLMETGEFSPPRLRTLERALELALRLGRGRVFADTWNLDMFSNCPACLRKRNQRLEEMNQEQKIPPPIQCARCDGFSADRKLVPG